MPRQRTWVAVCQEYVSGPIETRAKARKLAADWNEFGGCHLDHYIVAKDEFDYLRQADRQLLSNTISACKAHHHAWINVFDLQGEFSAITTDTRTLARDWCMRGVFRTDFVIEMGVLQAALASQDRKDLR